MSLAPAPGVSPALQARAEVHARRVLDALGYVGVLAIELFQVGDGLLANEMAPRVHNSGHWTIEGAETSQFENHLRAVAGLPLGATARAGRERDAQPDRRAARPGGGARDARRAPAPLRQGAAPRPEGRPRHARRRTTGRSSTGGSRASGRWSPRIPP